ncbi:hypothetical protein HK153_07460, partial [Streptococcus agalactiae]|nr:hypothetical protein [Streptococcus agalactiae]
SEESIFIVKHWIDILLSYDVLRLVDGKYEIINNIYEKKINDKSIRNICEYAANLVPELTDILMGDRDAIEVFYAIDSGFSVSELCENLIGYDESARSILKSLKNLVTLN